MAQVVKADRGLLARGMSAGHIPHGSGVGGGGKAGSPKGTGGGSGGGSGKSTMDSFGPESETLPGFQLGPFILSEPKASSRATAAQKAHAEAMDQMQQVYGKALDQNGGDPQAAMLAVLRDPQTRGFLVSHPDMLGASGDAMHKVLGKAQGDKGSDHQVVGNQLVNKLDGTSRTIQTENGPMAAPTGGGFSFEDDPNNPGQKIIVSTGGSAPGKAGPRPVITQPNANTAQGGIANRDADTASKIEHRANQDATAAEKLAQGGKPGTVSNEDKRLFSVAGNAYELLAHLKEYAGYSGPFTGFLKEKGGEYFGASEAGQAFANIEDRMQQAAQQGLLDSKYVGMVNQFKSTLPSISKSSDFNTGLINGMQDDMRHRLQSRADAAEYQLNRGGQVKGPDGNPMSLDPSTQNELKRADVYTQSQRGSASPTWKLRNTPDQVTRKDAEELESQTIRDPGTGAFVRSANPHMLPQDDATFKQLVQDRMKAQQARQPQPIPSPAPAAPQGGGPTPAAPQGSAPQAPPEQRTENEDTTPYAPDPRLASNRAAEEEAPV